MGMIVRDWVVRFNAEGPALVDRRRRKQPKRGVPSGPDIPDAKPSSGHPRRSTGISHAMKGLTLGDLVATREPFHFPKERLLQTCNLERRPIVS